MAPGRSESPAPAPAPAPAPPLRRRILAELGLLSLFRSPRDVRLLCLLRFVRLFAYGASTLVLVSLLRALGHSPARIGLFMTLTLVADACASLPLAIVADAAGRRVVLALGAFLMAGAGVVFACASSFPLLLAAAILGVVSPAGNEVGPFRAVEESVLAHLTPPGCRADVYAWYGLFGTAGTAFGIMACGWAVDAARLAWGWPLLRAYRAVFVAYAVLGVVKLVLTLCLSRAVEADKDVTRKPAAEAPASAATSGAATSAAASTAATSTTGETTPLLSSGLSPATPGKRRWALLPDISSESKATMATLCLLFALDSFASGLAPLSWVTFFFRSRYGVQEGRLGSIFFTTSIISAASVIVAASLSRRIGNVKTMVFTHLPSAIFLALIPVPHSLPLSLMFLVLRACTQSMDVAPRSAFLAAVLLPSERTAVMGFLNVVKTAAQSLGPLITGLLANHGLFWLSFVCAGSLKACYDLGLLAVFKNHERDRHGGEARDRGQDEEAR